MNQFNFSFFKNQYNQNPRQFIFFLVIFLIILLLPPITLVSVSNSKKNTTGNQGNSKSSPLNLKSINLLSEKLFPSWFIHIKFDIGAEKFSLVEASIKDAPLTAGPANIFSSYNVALLDKAGKVVYSQRVRINDFPIIDTFGLPSKIQYPKSSESAVYIPYKSGVSKIQIRKGLKTLLTITAPQAKEKTTIKPNENINFVNKADAAFPTPFCRDKALRVLIIPFGYDNASDFTEDADQLIRTIAKLYPDFITTDTFFRPEELVDFTKECPLSERVGQIECAEEILSFGRLLKNKKGETIQGPIRHEERKFNTGYVEPENYNLMTLDFSHSILLIDYNEADTGARSHAYLGGPTSVLYKEYDYVQFANTAVHEIVGHGIGWLMDRYIEKDPSKIGESVNRALNWMANDGTLWSNCSDDDPKRKSDVTRTGEDWWYDVPGSRKVCEVTTGCGSVNFLYAPAPRDCVDDHNQDKSVMGPHDSVMGGCYRVNTNASHTLFSSDRPVLFDQYENYWMQNYVKKAYTTYTEACEVYSKTEVIDQPVIINKALCDAGDCSACSVSTCREHKGCFIYQGQSSTECVNDTSGPVPGIEKGIACGKGYCTKGEACSDGKCVVSGTVPDGGACCDAQNGECPQDTADKACSSGNCTNGVCCEDGKVGKSDNGKLSCVDDPEHKNATLPDFIVTSLSVPEGVTAVQDIQLTLSGIIKNIGKTFTSKTQFPTAVFCLDDPDENCKNHDTWLGGRFLNQSFEKDKEYTVTPSENKKKTLTEGSHMLTLCIDSDSEIKESHEDNNCKTISFQVSSKQNCPANPIGFYCSQNKLFETWGDGCGGDKEIGSCDYTGDVCPEGSDNTCAKGSECDCGSFCVSEGSLPEGWGCCDSKFCSDGLTCDPEKHICVR